MNHKENKGFTLVELMIYITMVAGILIVATSFAWNVINNRTKSFAIQEVEENGRFIMDKITRTAQGAQSITLPLAGATGSAMDLIIESAPVTTADFILNSEHLQMSDNGGPYLNLNSNNVRVTSLEFKNLSSTDGRTKNIKIILSLEHVNPENRQEWKYSNSFETTIELRDQ